MTLQVPIGKMETCFSFFLVFYQFGLFSILPFSLKVPPSISGNRDPFSPHCPRGTFGVRFEGQIFGEISNSTPCYHPFFWGCLLATTETTNFWNSFIAPSCP
ncbi:hypothetical protein CDAR_302401 [Caerostris darwini]|uniref:Uncharacterized protein n=1 Tax=Caerostris darwini TaxID=1538125 RepID=A0AAV4UEU4_9ARAC|nr:hypothetical protein CDAR_302401 [Caerostris darwini]